MLRVEASHYRARRADAWRPSKPAVTIVGTLIEPGVLLVGGDQRWEVSGLDRDVAIGDRLTARGTMTTHKTTRRGQSAAVTFRLKADGIQQEETK
jgi:hypothetical protein